MVLSSPPTAGLVIVYLENISAVGCITWLNEKVRFPSVFAAS